MEGPGSLQRKSGQILEKTRKNSPGDAGIEPGEEGAVSGYLRHPGHVVHEYPQGKEK